LGDAGKRVTLAQVAEAAGVSVYTTSRILNSGVRNIYPKAAQRAEHIRQVARRLGYLPNAAASAVARGRFNCAAVLESTQDHRSSFFGGAMLDGIHDALAERDMHVLVAKMPDAKLVSDEFMPKILRELMADGLLLNYFCDIPPRMQELIDIQSLPAVWINSRQKADCVYPDDFDAACRATRHLLELGHRKIAYAATRNTWTPQQGGEPAHYSLADRLNGYTQTMRNAGLPTQLASPSQQLGGRERLVHFQNYLDQADRPTAVICYDWGTADSLLHAALTKGLSVPGDLSLIAFAEQPTLACGVTLTSFLLDWAAVGRRAAERLCQRIALPRRHLKPEALTCEFVQGETCSRIVDIS
jgi:DNA-binding LacI/PurR family transcriptional regulator